MAKPRVQVADVFDVLEEGLKETVEELCCQHDSIPKVLLEMQPHVRHFAVTLRHEELAEEWDSMSKDEQLQRWRAFCRRWIAEKGTTYFKGKGIDIDHINPGYRGQIDPAEC